MNLYGHFFVFIFFVTTSYAQKFQLGLHFGCNNGLSFRYEGQKKLAAELKVEKHYKFEGAAITLNAQKIVDVGNNFFVYAGGGLFFSYYKCEQTYMQGAERKSFFYWEPSWGGALTAGLEYRPKKLPFIIGTDLQARWQEMKGPFLFEPGLNLRYIF